MSQRRLTLTIDLPFAFTLSCVLILHALFLFAWGTNKISQAVVTSPQTFQIRELSRPDLIKIRKIGEKNAKGLNQVLVNKGLKGGQERVKPNPFVTAGQFNRTSPQRKFPKTNNPYRPTERARALMQLSREAEPIHKVASRTQHAGAQALAGSPTLSKSLMNMQVEVPEGVAVDELNEFELQFYGFQKRLITKYLNSIELQVREYEKRYALKTLSVDGRHTMTGRVTFDSDGNIKQIKMIRWTQADRLQAMFEDILKSMMSLPNPPKMLRNKDGEFVVFYTLMVNNS